MDVTWRDVIGCLGASFEDAAFLDVLRRLGQAEPGGSLPLVQASPHGVSFVLTPAGDLGRTDIPDLVRVVESVHVYLVDDGPPGVWRGDLPAWLTRDAKAEDVAARGFRRDPDPDATVVTIEDGELELVLTFYGELDRIGVTPIAVAAARMHQILDELLAHAPRDQVLADLGPYADEPRMWAVLEQRFGSEVAAAVRARSPGRPPLT